MPCCADKQSAQACLWAGHNELAKAARQTDKSGVASSDNLVMLEAERPSIAIE